jgi:hypothetical protein
MCFHVVLPESIAICIADIILELTPVCNKSVTRGTVCVQAWPPSPLQSPHALDKCSLAPARLHSVHAFMIPFDPEGAAAT